MNKLNNGNSTFKNGLGIHPLPPIPPLGLCKGLGRTLYTQSEVLPRPKLIHLSFFMSLVNTAVYLHVLGANQNDLVPYLDFISACPHVLLALHKDLVSSLS